MSTLPFDFRPDPEAASPLYLQLAQALAKAIHDGRYQADEALPSERLLAESLSLSRVTARKAIERLTEQGLIVRKRGSGNYIAPRLEQPLTRLSGFSEELHQRGFVPGSRWLKRGFTPAAADEQLSLELHGNERVARLERLRLADSVIMAYEVSVLPASILPDPEAVNASLYAHLAQRGNAPVRALQHIRALNADAKLAGLMEIPVGAAVLFITRVGYLASGQAVELTHSYCRSDYYDFVAEMRRD
ncbi:GntR family transcriptional regulator [Inhella crocodyli]|jgi:GntR family transcriptional regulator|uniref:GntR family transcriptional regulator n=1 Tax=Inhella crocodyli TaxID=2499851 RepID=A0A3S2WN32_9BURK|nr:GntR family transcriptional regulator [Inhella crocodyli]RVT83716.1 GntR family transcriptional regulator [Inhella crocodyli]